MSKPDGRITGREFKPGCFSLTFEAPCARDADRLHHLLCALEEWRKSNPGIRIDYLTIIREQSLVAGFLVDHSTIASDDLVLSFDLVEPVVKKYGMEYMAARMHDAAAHYISREVKGPIVAMLSRRQIAIVVYHSRSRGYILDMELFLATLDASEATFVREGVET